jgi:hypothetical protein
MDISQLDSNDRTDVALGGLRTTGDQTTQDNILRVCSTMGRPVHNTSTSSTSTSIRDSPHTTQASDSAADGRLSKSITMYYLPSVQHLSGDLLLPLCCVKPHLSTHLSGNGCYQRLKLATALCPIPQDVTYGHLASPATRPVDRSPVAWDAPDAPFNPNLCLIAVAESGQHLLTLHSAAHKAGSFHPPLSSLL